MKLEELLEDIGYKVVSKAKQNLVTKRKVATGNLKDSIQAVITGRNSDAQLSFLMADYGKYVDQGVNGLKVNNKSKFSYKQLKGNGSFLKSLKEWCKIKGIEEGIAYYIRKNIFNEGLYPTYFFTDAYEEETKDLEKKIDQWFQDEIDNQLDYIASLDDE